MNKGRRIDNPDKIELVVTEAADTSSAAKTSGFLDWHEAFRCADAMGWGQIVVKRTEVDMNKKISNAFKDWEQ